MNNKDLYFIKDLTWCCIYVSYCIGYYLCFFSLEAKFWLRRPFEKKNQSSFCHSFFFFFSFLIFPIWHHNSLKRLRETLTSSWNESSGVSATGRFLSRHIVCLPVAVQDILCGQLCQSGDQRIATQWALNLLTDGCKLCPCRLQQKKENHILKNNREQVKPSW